MTNTLPDPSTSDASLIALEWAHQLLRAIVNAGGGKYAFLQNRKKHKFGHSPVNLDDLYQRSKGDFADALDMSFDWTATSEGYDHWDEIYNNLRNQQPEEEKEKEMLIYG